MGIIAQRPFTTRFFDYAVLWARRGLSTDVLGQGQGHVDNRSSVHRVVASQLNSPFLRVSTVFLSSKSWPRSFSTFFTEWMMVE
ncbi:hypothetical protein YM18_0002 [Geobacter sulfurreducens]|nr:hypothetical protein YM18_0002 [Geobacter sulfurreducens]